MPTYLYRIQPTRSAMLAEGPTPEEARAIGAHFAYLQALAEAGRLFMAGRTLNTDASSFGIALYEARDDAAAQAVLRDDPAVRHGVMRGEVLPFRAALWAGDPRQAQASAPTAPAGGPDVPDVPEGPGLRVQRLAVADAPAYRTLMLEAYEQAADAFTSTAEERAREPLAWWEARIAAPEGGSTCFGAFDGEHLVGTVALEYASKPKTRHAALVLGMYVQARARRQGGGRLLMQAALAAARARPGLRQLRLTVTEGNRPAIALYESLGFRRWGLEPEAILTPSGYKGKVHMALTLPGAAP
jgi:RimJ/RimL family protein N-acetyltransferase/uncharacterized protein YciI